MSHEKILAMLKRQVAADGGAMSGGAMSGGAMSGGLAAYHQWRSQQPPMSREELKTAWREHKASGGFIGEKAVRQAIKDNLLAERARARYLEDQRKQIAHDAKVNRADAALRKKALKEANLRQYNRPGETTTAELHAALAKLGVPADVYMKTKVSKPRPTYGLQDLYPQRVPRARRMATPEPVLDADAAVEAMQPDEEDPMAVLGLGLSGGRYYR